MSTTSPPRFWPAATPHVRSFRRVLPLIVVGLALTGAAAASGDANPELRSLAASCAACHGTNGHSEANSTLPSLAHLQAAYFIARMRAFREEDSLTSSVMAQIAKGYDDRQVEQLATYFAAQP